MSEIKRTSRRNFLIGTAATAFGGSGIFLSGVKNAYAGTFDVSMQLGWLLSNGQIGEIVAAELGYFEEENVSLKIVPGGPNVDGVASVSAGRSNLGQVSSSPSLMLARSAGIPIKCIAAGYQRHPFTYFSLKSNPVRTPMDLVGKKIGTQPTAKILLRALLAKNKISENDVEVTSIGYNMAPLKNGQVDVITGWQTNTNALKILGDQRVDMMLWDTGVRLYANPYYVTDTVLNNHRDDLIRFFRASAKGWGWAFQNQEKAVEMMVKKYPKMNLEQEKAAIGLIMNFVFNNSTKVGGWATMKTSDWQDQLDIYSKLGQFKQEVPKVDDVMTLDILNATADVRPKFG